MTVLMKYEGDQESKFSFGFPCKVLMLQKNQLFCYVEYISSFNLSSYFLKLEYRDAQEGNFSTPPSLSSLDLSTPKMLCKRIVTS